MRLCVRLSARFVMNFFILEYRIGIVEYLNAKSLSCISLLMLLITHIAMTTLYELTLYIILYRYVTMAFFFIIGLCTFDII